VRIPTRLSGIDPIANARIYLDGIISLNVRMGHRRPVSQDTYDRALMQTIRVFIELEKFGRRGT
jgi:hypothetical protein